MDDLVNCHNLAEEVMQRLFGENIYEGFHPDLPLDLNDWNSTHPAFGRIIAGLKPRVCLDVGVWKGASTVHIAAHASQITNDYVVIGIDRFLGTFQPSYGIRRERGRCQLYEQFMANAYHKGFAAKVIPLAETSTEAALVLEQRNIVADFIHLDASHEYEDVLSDLRSYWRILRLGGVMMGDDYSPSWPGVIRAAHEFAELVGLPLIADGPKFIVSKSH